MADQKLENLLLLSLAATPQERSRSESLASGYDGKDRTWELVVKHSGPLPEMFSDYSLLNNYSILTVPEELVDYVSSLPQVEYVEKPKRLYFAVHQAKSASCITSLQIEGNSFLPNLTGRGVLVAVLDSGIDYFHEDFRNEDGTTRIAALWDQDLDRVFSREEIDRALAAGSRAEARELAPSFDGSGHGTAVAGIAAGNGRASGGKYRGVAYESDILVVKLKAADSSGFPRTTELMKGLDYAVRYAAEAGMPLAVNISFGNTYGPHDGTSILETYIDDVAAFGKTAIIVGTGNEGAAGGHASGSLIGGNPQELELSVSPYETGLTVQLWKSYVDQFQIALVAPDGKVLGPLPPVIGPQTWDYGNTRILLYYGEPNPYSAAQEIYFDIMPIRGDYLQSGIWKFRMTPEKILKGRYDFWLPSSAALNRSTYFLTSSPEATLTIPSTARGAISVGAYDSAYQTYADFSGRGFLGAGVLTKPDIAAPGVNLMAPKRGGGYEAVTGTSFAAPVAAGSAALLMQWGIADGNDPFLYGEKLKAYFWRGAKQLPGYDTWPNPQLGWGTLCVRDSLPA